MNCRSIIKHWATVWFLRSDDCINNFAIAECSPVTPWVINEQIVRQLAAVYRLIDGRCFTYMSSVNGPSADLSKSPQRPVDLTFKLFSPVSTNGTKTYPELINKLRLNLHGNTRANSLFVSTYDNLLCSLHLTLVSVCSE